MEKYPHLRDQHTPAPSDATHNSTRAKWRVSAHTGGGASTWNSVSQPSLPGDSDVARLVANHQKENAPATVREQREQYCQGATPIATVLFIIFFKNYFDNLNVQTPYWQRHMNPQI